MPCAGCGKLLWRSTTSRPEGQARCRDCWRAEAAHGSAAKYQKHGCRCDVCRSGQAARQREKAAAHRERTGQSLYAQYRSADADSRSGGWISRKRRLAIYERDGWTCHICRQAVDRDDPNGDLAPSLDHIVPRSLGGPNADDNLACAHRSCNSKRGARDDVAA